MSGFSAHDDFGSHAPSTNSTLGLDHVFNWNAEPITEGPAPTLRLLPALAPFLRRPRSKVPVRDTDLVHRSTLRPREALRPFLGHRAKMPRIRFYNRRFASRAPMSRHYLWRLPAERRGKPADVRPRDRFRIDGVFAPLEFDRDAGPPCGHPASNGCALDGASPALGRSAATSRADARGGGKAPEPCRLAATSPNRTL